MEVLILEPEKAFEPVLKEAFRAHFKNVKATFRSTPGEIRQFISQNQVDLAVIDCKLEDMDLFLFLEEMRSNMVPFILMARNPPYRLVVEGMRAGALDFLSKSKFDSHIFGDMIKRALLEADQWHRLQKFACTLEHRPLVQQLDDQLKSVIFGTTKSGQGGSFHTVTPIEGDSYLMTFLNFQLTMPDEYGATDINFNTSESTNNKILDNLIKVQTNLGGVLFSRAENNLIFAYLNQSPSHCMQALLRLYGYMNTLKFSLSGYIQKPYGTIAVASSNTIYRENKSEIYSEALNLSAHIAVTDTYEKHMVVTEDFHNELSPREKRYFHIIDPYLGNQLYKFTNLH